MKSTPMHCTNPQYVTVSSTLGTFMSQGQFFYIKTTGFYFIFCYMKVTLKLPL